MISHENMNTAAVGAKTARACDHCIRKRARWYCAADDAFLCQACDGSVHSANSLARRHERVRLKTASLKCPSEERPCIPSWHRGHNRRARTPRHGKHQPKLGGHVPELGRSSNSTTTSNEDYEHDQMQLLYRVPIMDPFVSELCNSTATSGELAWAGESKYTEMILVGEDGQDDKCNESLLSFDLDMDIDMAEFAADVETLLGKGLDGEINGIEELGLLECNGRGPLVKAKEEIVPSAPNMEGEMEVIREPFELCFDYNSPASCEENDAKEAGEAYRTTNEEKSERRMSLRLDYEAISAAWASQGSPWMNGEKPKINPNDGWLHGTMEGAGTIRAFGEVGMTTGQGPSGDGGREARVLRYREKRRTRLFSKKIRYEVRKLNAEKRPRMKGRFVKRSSFNTTPTPFPLLSK